MDARVDIGAESRTWEQEGLISAEQGEALRARYQAPTEPMLSGLRAGLRDALIVLAVVVASIPVFLSLEGSKGIGDMPTTIVWATGSITLIALAFLPVTGATEAGRSAMYLVGATMMAWGQYLAPTDASSLPLALLAVPALVVSFWVPLAPGTRLAAQIVLGVEALGALNLVLPGAWEPQALGAFLLGGYFLALVQYGEHRGASHVVLLAVAWIYGALLLATAGFAFTVDGQGMAVLGLMGSVAYIVGLLALTRNAPAWVTWPQPRRST